MSLLILALALFNQNADAQLAEGYRVLDSDKRYIESFKRPELVIDHVNYEGYEIYGPAGLGEYLTKMNIPHINEASLKDANLGPDHPTAEEIESQIKVLVAKCSSIMQVENIGKSVKGRNLLFVKVSDNPNIDETEPEFKYISSMHGDEITGRDLMMRLLNDICDNYGKDARITDLVNNTEIYIMPSMNPDGSNSRQRWNASGVDLNRDFPDFSTSDNQNSPVGRAAETQAIMKWEAGRQIALSVNFHGGAEVVNYVWDTLPDAFPFESMVIDLSLRYSKLVPYIYNSNEFQQGITNGYSWYEVNGGMQDWSYYWHNDLQFTIELSNTKWASFSSMPTYWSANRPALLEFIAAVHQGTGFRFDDKATEGSVELVEYLSNASRGHFNFVGGEFYKVLEPGKYKMIVSTKKGVEKTIYVEVPAQLSLTSDNYVQL